MATSTQRAHLRAVDTGREKDELSLALALQQGLGWAHRDAWHRYSPRVTAILRRGLGPSCEVEDQVQEVFVRFFNGVHSLRDPAALWAFVLAITMNVMKGALRKIKVRKILRLVAPADLPDQAVLPSQPSSLLLRRFYAVLDTLGSEERTIFVLRCMEGVDMETIRGGLGLSRSTLRRRLDRVSEKVLLRVASDRMLSEFVSPELMHRWRRNHVEGE